MDINIEELNLEDIIPRNISYIIGDSKSGKSILIKDIISKIYKKYSYGIVCTDKVHKNAFYNFLDGHKIYNRYSPVIIARCFFNNMYLILDNILYKNYLDEIYDNYQGKNMIILISSLKFFINDIINYDYIFICKFKNISEIYKIYNYCVQKFNITIEQFINIINKCTDEYEILVINCKAMFINELFMVYTAEVNKDLNLREDKCNQNL